MWSLKRDRWSSRSPGTKTKTFFAVTDGSVNDGKTFFAFSRGIWVNSLAKGHQSVPAKKCYIIALSSYSHSPSTPASNFVPHSLSSGSSGAWSSWSASTPQSSTSISAGAVKVHHYSEEKILERSEELIWKSSAGTHPPETASPESDRDTVPEIPTKFHHPMTR